VERLRYILFVELRDAFGIDGEKMYEVSEALLRDRESELGLED